MSARRSIPAEARSALEDLAALDVERHPHEPLLQRIWTLRQNLTAYCSPATGDWRAPGVAVRVELLDR